MMLPILVLVALALVAPGNGFEDNDLYGIAYIQQTVADMDMSKRYYTDVMGGLLITEWSRKNVQSDADYYRMFQKEIMEAEDKGVSPQSLGVPDIKTNGQHVMNWEFVLYDNCLLWLIQFTDEGGNLVRYFDSNIGMAKVGFPHMSFVGQDDTNPYQMIESLMDEEDKLGYEERGFISMDNVDTFAERRRYYDDGNINRFMFEMPADPVFPGSMFASTRGPSGERVEFGWRRDNDIGNMCEHETAHTLLLKHYPFQNNKYEKDRIKTFGFHHVAFTVKNITASNLFYTKIVGGKNVRVFSEKDFGPGFENYVFQDSALYAEENNIPLDETYGYVEIRQNMTNAGGFELSYINFDNYFLEFYSFYPKDPSKKKLLDREQNLTPAYLNNMQPGFWVKENVPLADFARHIEREAEAMGWSEAKANRAQKVDMFGQDLEDEGYTGPAQSGDLQGFEYLFVKGLAGEQFSIAKFTGRAAKILKTKYMLYGGVSTAFDETNPFVYNGHREVCHRDKALTKAVEEEMKKSGWDCFKEQGWHKFWDCVKGSH